MTRKEAIEFLKNMVDREAIGFVCPKGDGDVAVWEYHVMALNMAIEALEQPESCEYYALCRHGRDENKLRSALGRCEYCNEDSDGYVKPLEKNGHAFVWFGMNGWVLNLRAKGWRNEVKINYCPMCGRRLNHE